MPLLEYFRLRLPAAGAALAGCLLITTGISVAAAASPAPMQVAPNELAARTAAYFNPDRSGEGIFVEILPEGRALVYLFSYGPRYVWGSDPPLVHEHGQTWMVGVGRQTEWGLQVDEMLWPTGGRFGAAFDPGQVVYNSFGPLFFTYPTCDSSAGRGYLALWQIGNSTFDFQDLELDNYVQLGRVLDCHTGEGSRNVGRTGSWFDPSRPGEGLVLQVLADDRTIVQWMTFDDAGGQLWIQGIGAFDDTGQLLTVDDLRTYGGTYWGGDFNSGEILAAPFGSLTLEFFGCEFATMDYVSHAYGTGRLELKRLTTPLHINDAGADCWDY